MGAKLFGTMQNPNPQQLPPSAELKTLRCGSSLCWMVAMVAMACIGLICLILATVIYYGGDPSYANCAAEDNYLCGVGKSEGCWDDSASGSCGVLADTTTDCPSGSGKYNLYLACECSKTYTCERARGSLAAFAIGVICLILFCVFVCGVVPCVCFADTTKHPDQHAQGVVVMAHPQTATAQVVLPPPVYVEGTQVEGGAPPIPTTKNDPAATQGGTNWGQECLLHIVPLITEPFLNGRLHG